MLLLSLQFMSLPESGARLRRLTWRYRFNIRKAFRDAIHDILQSMLYGHYKIRTMKLFGSVGLDRWWVKILYNDFASSQRSLVKLRGLF